MRSHHGQTLFELTISLLIVSFGLLFAIEGWSHLVEEEHARTAINRMVVAVREARHLALSRRQRVTLCPKADSEQATCGKDWSGPLVIFSGLPESTNKTVMAIYPAIDRGRLSWRSFRSLNYLPMQENGMTFAQNGTFIYCPDDNNPRHARALVINKAGRGRLAVDLDGDGIVDLEKGETVSCQ